MEEREKWWIEIRNEIRSHMKSLSCHAVIGYTETKSIYEDVCVLSATGTAAKGTLCILIYVCKLFFF